MFCCLFSVPFSLLSAFRFSCFYARLLRNKQHQKGRETRARFISLLVRTQIEINFDNWMLNMQSFVQSTSECEKETASTNIPWSSWRNYWKRLLWTTQMTVKWFMCVLCAVNRECSEFDHRLNKLFIFLGFFLFFYLFCM